MTLKDTVIECIFDRYSRFGINVSIVVTSLSLSRVICEDRDRECEMLTMRLALKQAQSCKSSSQPTYRGPGTWGRVTTFTKWPGWLATLL